MSYPPPSASNYPGDGICGRQWRALILIFTAILVTYANSLDCDWHYDDLFNIVDNPAIRMDRFDKESIARAILEGGQRKDRVMRPLAYLSFAINYRFGQLDVLGYHLVNLCIHVLTAIVLFFLIQHILLLAKRNEIGGLSAGQVALLATLFWAIHPINVTAVTYIVQRMASMAALFYLLSMLLYLRGRVSTDNWRRGVFFIFSLLAGLGAMATKENAAMLPISIFALEIYFLRSRDQALPLWLKLMLITGVGLLLAYGIYKLTLGGLLLGYEKRPFTPIQRLLTQPRILIFYLGLFLYPTGPRMMMLHDPVISTGLLTPWTTLPAITLICGGFLFSLFLRKRSPIIGFSLLFFCLNHAIESSIVPLEMVYEHRNYLPIAFLGLVLATGFARLLDFFRSSKVVYPFLILAGAFILGANGYSTHLYNDVFKTNLGMWLDNTADAPRLSVARSNLGNMLMAYGKFEEGAAAFEEALRHDRFNNNYQKAIALFNMGRALERLHGPGNQEAMNAYRRALAVSPTYPKALHNLAICYLRKGELQVAEALMKRARENSLHPNRSKLLNGLSIIELKMGKLDAAYRHARLSLQMAPIETTPNELTPLAILAEIHRQRGMPKMAASYWEAVLDRSPDSLEALLALTELYYRMDRKERVSPLVKRIIGLRPKESLNSIMSDQELLAHVQPWAFDLDLLKTVFNRHLKAEMAEMEGGVTTRGDGARGVVETIGSIPTRPRP
jgi:tetratricopeptide (TPR) repeat protein